MKRVFKTFPIQIPIELDEKLTEKLNESGITKINFFLNIINAYVEDKLIIKNKEANYEK
jgi:predicted DNA-binding protein